jgi:hypothetical protein
MIYKGIPYEYAFTFKLPIENNQNREFNVVISNYREDSQDFSGLCLENELRVISEEKMLFAAFYDIVDSITKITIEGEKVFARDYPDETICSLMSVTDTDFIKRFEQQKQSKKSLEYYEKLRIWFENPKSLPERVFYKPSKPDIFYCQTMVNFNYLARAKQSLIQQVEFFKL